MKTEDKSFENIQGCPMAIIRRNEGQDFLEFKKIQSETNKSIRLFTKGILLHDSSTGTYDVGNNKMKFERKINHEINRKRMKSLKRK